MPGIDVGRLFSMTGLTALVTGGGGALGAAVAEGFLLSGARVAVADISAAGMAEKVKSLGEIGVVSAHECDVTDPASVKDMVSAVEDEHGPIHVVCNAAGIAQRTPATELEMDEFRRIWEVNIGGTWLVSQAVGRRMIEAGRRGKIINIGSVRGLVGHPLGYVAYGTSKGVVHLFTRQLATEWAKYNINVNCLAPSVINTPLAAFILDDPERRKMFMDRTPLQRVAEPSDVVAAAIFMATAASDFITGQVLFVDGGSTAG